MGPEVRPLGSGSRMLLVLVAILGFALPVVAAWWWIHRTPSISADAALKSVACGSAVVVDVGPDHGGRRWSRSEIQKLKPGDPLPADLAGKDLILRCDSGVLSAWATQDLHRVGQNGVRNLAGGMIAWKTAQAAARQIPLRKAPWWEQWGLVLTGFGIKPLYMLLSLVLAFWLRRAVDADLIAVRRGAIVFFLGELACALNYIIWAEGSLLAEHLHSFGMVLAFACFSQAALVGFDQRLLHVDDPRRACTALSLCRRCIKQDSGACGLQRLFLVLIPMTALTALMLPASALVKMADSTEILGTPYTYTHHVLHQIFEMRLCPIVGILLCLASWLVLVIGGRPRLALAKVLFAAGLGPILFGFFRGVLLGLYRDRLFWFQQWEEFGELSMILLLLWVVWIFRQSLLARSSSPAAG